MSAYEWIGKAVCLLAGIGVVCVAGYWLAVGPLNDFRKWMIARSRRGHKASQGHGFIRSRRYRLGVRLLWPYLRYRFELYQGSDYMPFGMTEDEHRQWSARRAAKDEIRAIALLDGRTLTDTKDGE